MEPNKQQIALTSAELREAVVGWLWKKHPKLMARGDVDFQESPLVPGVAPGSRVLVAITQRPRKELGSLTEADLTYADTAAGDNHCSCGAPLAHITDCDTDQHFWDCSAILLGQAVPQGEPGWKTHTGKLPFAFYDIRSRRTDR